MIKSFINNKKEENFHRASQKEGGTLDYFVTSLHKKEAIKSNTVITQLLHDCVDPVDGRIVVIATVSPVGRDYRETLNTLEFASSCRNVIQQKTITTTR